MEVNQENAKKLLEMSLKLPRNDPPPEEVTTPARIPFEKLPPDIAKHYSQDFREAEKKYYEGGIRDKLIMTHKSQFVAVDSSGEVFFFLFFSDITNSISVFYRTD